MRRGKITTVWDIQNFCSEELEFSVSSCCHLNNHSKYCNPNLEAPHELVLNTLHFNYKVAMNINEVKIYFYIL